MAIHGRFFYGPRYFKKLRFTIKFLSIFKNPYLTNKFQNPLID
ncbi:hypothetical protein SAMN04488513_11367 [Pseudozobellia thermophila]|uniref:Uncharacterized protein n=1 Tax=Pseudozobellia thermophila TaxID=192903 RepID=A0A1M6NI06_9FLAO|nr:hypothetical protein SAMN04488513_11367 [Pseudozobellia thermophila]